MRRGTTPTHVFTTSVDLQLAEEVFMTYKQCGKTIVEKTIEDIAIEEDKMTIKLSQAETLAFNATAGDAQIQCRARFPDGNAIASGIVTVPVCKILKDGEI